MEQSLLDKVAQASKTLGVESFVVGGFVRDKLLNRPNKDIDINCVGSGIELAKATQKLFNPKPNLSVFKKFGTAQLSFPEGSEFADIDMEFVGARKESYQKDSRKPIVEDGTLQDDLKRRDFTINALAVSLTDNESNQIIDLFDGLAHMDQQLIKTPLDPDVTFSDDPLRMLRAIRFASQLYFEIDDDCFEAIKRNKDRIKIISQERIAAELNKIIVSTIPSTGFHLLFNSGLLEIIFPEMQALHGVEVKHGKAHKDNFYHTLQVLDNVSLVSNDLWLRWAAILHDIAKPPTKRFESSVGWTFHGHEVVGVKMAHQIFKRLKLPLNDRLKFVQKMVRLHLRPIPLVKEGVTDSALRRLLYDAGDDIDDLMKLCNADITSKNEKKVKQYQKNFVTVREKLKEVEEKDHIRNFQPPISGEEIMRLFDLQPGRDVGRIKKAVKDAILDGEIRNDYDEALAFVKEWVLSKKAE